MRLFLTLCSLAVLASAKPQYNYGAGVSGSIGSGGVGGSGGFLSAPSNTHGVSTYGSSGLAGGHGGSSGLGSIGFGQLGGGSSGLGSIGFGQLGGGSYGGGSGLSSSGGSGIGFAGLGGGSSGGSFGSAGGSGGFGGSSGHSAGGAYQAPIIHKQFISVAAPEDHENLEQSKHFVLGRPQKNYRVVFIKAPASSSANVKLSAEYAPQEEKTVIYVLSKKDSTLEVNDIATPAPTVPSKPEVFFIKYKTDEEAQHAQRQIQAEYDKIEGTSEHTDGGIAPQQSVVGILDGGAGGGSIGGGSVGGGHYSTSGAYHGASSSLSTSSIGSGVVGSGGSGGIGAASAAYLPPAGH